MSTTMTIPEYFSKVKSKSRKYSERDSRIELMNTLVSEVTSLNKPLTNNKLERIAKIIKSNKSLEKFIVISVGAGLFLMSNPVLAADTSIAMKGIDSMGTLIFTIMKRLCYWACIIMCVMEVIKSLSYGDTKSVSKISVKYVVTFMSIYLVPWILNSIKDIF